jgi:flavodoxin I
VFGVMNIITNVAGGVADSIRRLCLHISYASTSGHTDYVVDVLIGSLKDMAPGWKIEKTMAERTQPRDLLRGDVLLLASSTWNTWSVEGQLNPYMWILLQDRARNLDLDGKPCACIGLGDHRYFYTARAADHLQHYVETHHGRLILPALRIVNEPYDQQERVRAWGKQLVDAATQPART